MPSERPVRNASSSSAAGCLPCPIRAEPWPIAATIVPSRNLTVWAVEATAVAASRANAPDDATNEHSAPQSPLNSRRFSALFTTPSVPLLTMLGPKVVLPNRFRRQAAHIACWSFGRRCLLMGWSGRAPAPPVTNLARGSKDKGARHVPEPQQRNRRDRHRYRQKLIPCRRAG